MRTEREHLSGDSLQGYAPRGIGFEAILGIWEHFGFEN
jgi:hypothetical protein